MSVYGELDPLVEHRIQLAFKGKSKYISKVSIPNIAYPGQHIDTEIPHGSSDHGIVPDTAKITFNLDTESTNKARSVVNNVGRALVKKKVLKLGSKNIDTIDNSDVYHTYKDLYMSEKEREERLLQDIQSVNGSKPPLGAKKADGTALTIQPRKMQLKRRLIKSFQYR